MTEKNLQHEERKLMAAVNAEIYNGGVDKGELAEAAGVSQVMLSRSLAGYSRMDAGTWKKICKHLGLDYDKICEVVPEQPGCAHEPPAVEVVVREEKMPEGVLVKTSPVEMYRLFLFCEERMTDNLKMGTRLPPEELYKVLQAMYALRDASLALQPGEATQPA